MLCNLVHMLTRQQAKARLKSGGWSYRRVAPLLKITHVHLAKVLGGERESRRLMRLIASLPVCPVDQIPHNSPRLKERVS